MKSLKKITAMILTIAMCITMFASALSANAAVGTISTADKNRVVGYFPSYRTSTINSIDYSVLTHLVLSFMTYSNGTLTPTFSDSNVKTILAKCKANNVKVLIAIGGGGGFDTSDQPLSTAAKRTALVNSIMNYVDRLNLDGVDIDIEVTDSNVWANFNSFISELSGRLKAENKLLTMAVSSWFTGSVSNSTYNYFDFINLMTYDENAGTGPVASMNFVNQQISHYMSKGISADRLTIGVPFYGYTASGGWNGAKTYAEILAADANNRYSDYSTSFGGVYYNGEATIREKAEMSKNYGGIMIWELGQDSFGAYSLLSVIKDVMSTGAEPEVTLKGEKLTGTASASGVEDNDAQLAASMAVDGDLSTRWASPYSDNQNITIDLGKTSVVTGVKLVWEAAYASSYRIEFSADGNTWETAYTETAGNGGTDTIELDNISARYVRMQGVKRATEYGYSLYEFEVYGGTPISVPATFNSTAYYNKSSEIMNNTNYVGNLENGSYLDYLIDVPETGNYTISIMAAAGNSSSDRVISVYSGDTLLNTIPVFNSTNWFAYSELKNGIALEKGVQTLRLSSNGSTNISDIIIAKAPDTYTVPCTVNASNYMNAEGVVVVDGGTVKEFDYNDKAFYTVNIPETGEYKLTLTTAAAADAKVHIDTNINGDYAWVNSVDLPNTGSLTAFAETEATLNLTEGVQTLKFVVQTAFDFKGFKLEKLQQGEESKAAYTVLKIGSDEAYNSFYDTTVSTGRECIIGSNGKALLPLRPLAVLTYSEIEYNEATDIITLVNSYGVEMTMRPNSTECTISYDGNVETATINAPQIIETFTYLPVRDISMMTGFNIEYLETSAGEYIVLTEEKMSDAEYLAATEKAQSMMTK